MAEKRLTKETAEEFLVDEKAVDLAAFTVLDDDAAESLSKYKGYLSLDGLMSLSDAAAESLSKHKGYLSLDGLTSLSDAAAESLNKHKGYASLDGLTNLGSTDLTSEGPSRMTKTQVQESGSSQCASCGEDLYGVGQEYRNALHCPDCFQELTDGVIPAPLNEEPRGKVRDSLGGERKYQGGHFHAGEW